jgi:putative transposase
VFADSSLALAAATQLREALVYYDVSSPGYVLMPTHLHVMLGLKKGELLSRFMQSYKILSSKKIKRLMPETDRLRFIGASGFSLWTPRFDDLILTSEKQFRAKLGYIHNNPLKAGLVKNACDYRFSSAADWLKGTHGLIPIDKEYGWCNSA